MSKKRKILIAGSCVLCVVILALFLWWNTGNTRLFGFNPHENHPIKSIELSKYDMGSVNEPIEVHIDPSSLSWDRLERYVLSIPETGGHRSLVSFVPDVRIKTDLVWINILESGISIQKRRRTEDSFSQWVRTKTEDDEEMEQLVRSLLHEHTQD